MVKEAWEQQSVKDVEFKGKLEAVVKALIYWSKRKFPNNSRCIKALKQELQALTNNTSILQESGRIQNIKEEIEILWRRGDVLGIEF